MTTGCSIKQYANLVTISFILNRLKTTRKWIRDISTLNKLVAGRNEKEYYNDNAEMLRQKRRTYYHENKEKENEYKKKYMEINFEKMKEKRQIYNETNRDTILEKKKQYHITHKQAEQEYAKKKYEEEGKLKIECECGCVVTKCNLTRHAKTKLHTRLMTQKAKPQD